MVRGETKCHPPPPPPVPWQTDPPDGGGIEGEGKQTISHANGPARPGELFGDSFNELTWDTGNYMFGHSTLA